MLNGFVSHQLGQFQNGLNMQEYPLLRLSQEPILNDLMRRVDDLKIKSVKG